MCASILCDVGDSPDVVHDQASSLDVLLVSATIPRLAGNGIAIVAVASFVDDALGKGEAIVPVSFVNPAGAGSDASRNREGNGKSTTNFTRMTLIRLTGIRKSHKGCGSLHYDGKDGSIVEVTMSIG